MAVLTHCKASVRKELFLRRPPSPFDIGAGVEHESIDEDWLPDTKEIIAGGVHGLIDLKDDPTMR